MDPTTLPFTDEEMAEAGLLGEDVSTLVKQAVETMKEHPELLNFFSLFVLECIDYRGKHNSPGSPVPPRASSPTLSEASNLSALTISTDVTDITSPLISDYERTTFYNGITSSGDHPELFYRSDLLTNPFPVPRGRHATLPTKSARPVYNTPLNACWDTVAPKIVALLKNQSIRYSAIDPVRFFTHGPPGEEERGNLGPVTIWIAIHPGTTTVEAVHDASLGILELLKANGVEDAVVEWREGAPEKLSGPALLRVVNDTNPTHYVRRFLTAALGMPIAPATKEDDDVQGSVAFFFHENRNKKGTPVDTVLGVSNCHVLSKNTTVDYEFKGHGARAEDVRVNGFRRFQRALEEIKDCIGGHAIDADRLARDIIALEAKPKSEDPEEAEEHAEALVTKRAQLAKEKKDIDTLEKFYKEVNSQWSDIERRSIGYVHWAPKISVDVQGRKYAKDIATFVADPTKFRAQFKGNVVSLGSKYTAKQLTDFFYPQSGGRTTFRFPPNGELRINGWVTRELLANPDCRDSNGEPCLIVMKDGNTTDLTVGCYAGLESYLCDDLGVESIELAIYNYEKLSSPFSAKGDSGSLVFDGQGRMVGILHSGMPKGRSKHVTYATPAWWIVEELKKRYPYADFNRTSF